MDLDKKIKKLLIELAEATTDAEISRLERKLKILREQR